MVNKITVFFLLTHLARENNGYHYEDGGDKGLSIYYVIRDSVGWLPHLWRWLWLWKWGCWRSSPHLWEDLQRTSVCIGTCRGSSHTGCLSQIQDHLQEIILVYYYHYDIMKLAKIWCMYYYHAPEKERSSLWWISHIFLNETLGKNLRKPSQLWDKCWPNVDKRVFSSRVLGSLRRGFAKGC